MGKDLWGHTVELSANNGLFPAVQFLVTLKITSLYKMVMKKQSCCSFRSSQSDAVPMWNCGFDMRFSLCIVSWLQFLGDHSFNLYFLTHFELAIIRRLVEVNLFLYHMNLSLNQIIIFITNK